MTTQTEIRNSFWDALPEFAQLRRKWKKQNQYPATVRCAFVDFVDGLSRDGIISEALAGRVTL